MSKIGAMVIRDCLIFLRSRWKWLEFFYYPVTTLFIWGFFTIWTGRFASEVGNIALIINIFWSYAYVIQTVINLSINEDSWHGEGRHLFVAGVGKWEYIGARIVFSLAIVSSVNWTIMMLVTHSLFLDISGMAMPLVLFSALTAFLSVSLAILIAGLIFALGRDYNWLAWSTLQFFILFSFPLSPLRVLPSSIQTVARVMPYGELFEGIKNLLLDRVWMTNALSAFYLGFVYFAVGLLIYWAGFDYSRRSGKFAKMF